MHSLYREASMDVMKSATPIGLAVGIGDTKKTKIQYKQKE